MSILHVNKLYHPWVGGVEKMVQSLAEGITELHGTVRRTAQNLSEHEFEMAVLCCQPKGVGTEETINGVRVVRAGSFGILWGMPVSFDFFRRFKKLAPQFDILHIHHPFPLAAFALTLFPLRKNQRLVVTYHSNVVRQRILNPLLNIFLRRMLTRADRIIVSSPNLMDSSAILQPFKEKTVIVPFGVDLKNCELDSKQAATTQKIQKQYPGLKILFVGRLAYYKGLPYLLEAMARIAHGTLFLIGAGEKKNDLQLQAKRLGIEDRVQFLGHIPDNAVLSWLSACDILVLPSVEASEAFGLVQLEAMACGKPVINTALPTGVPWVSIHQETGLTVPPKDAKAFAGAMNKLIEDPALREKFGRNARRRVEEKFTLEQMIRETKNLYESITREPSSNSNFSA